MASFERTKAAQRLKLDEINIATKVLRYERILSMVLNSVMVGVYWGKLDSDRFHLLSDEILRPRRW